MSMHVISIYTNEFITNMNYHLTNTNEFITNTNYISLNINSYIMNTNVRLNL